MNEFFKYEVCFPSDPGRTKSIVNAFVANIRERVVNHGLEPGDVRIALSEQGSFVIVEFVFPKAVIRGQWESLIAYAVAKLSGGMKNYIKKIG